jgi:acetyl esterase
VADAREAELAGLSANMSERVAEVRDFVLPGPGGPIAARMYLPDAPRPLPLLAYFFGGGWVLGSLETVDPVCRRLANAAECAVVSIAYRRAPEHPFPAAVEDVLAATRALGADVVAGDSAGGNLAAVVARHQRDLKLQLLIYPVTDAGLNTPSYREFADGYGLTAAGMKRFWELYLDGADGTVPDASPLRATDLAGLPPAHVITAEYDVLRDEGEAYASKLEHATLVRVPGTIHGFWRWQKASSLARRTVEEAGAAIRAALA